MQDLFFEHPSKNPPAMDDLVQMPRAPIARGGKKISSGFTLVELLISLAILGTLASIGGYVTQNRIYRAEIARAVAEIRMLEKEIAMFQFENIRLPDSLAEIGRGIFLDPWNNPYQYKNLFTEKKDENGKPKGCRKDKSMNPLNSDYDLYSIGRDGRTQLQVTAQFGRDDIIRAGDGEFVGLGVDH